MHIQRALEQLGYSHNVIIAYLALLKMGEATVSEVSRKTQLPRSTTQLVMNELQKKGLASLCLKHNRSVWLAESPSHFLAAVHQNEAILREILPELHALRKTTEKKPVLKYYNGSMAIFHIFEEVLQSKYPVEILGSVHVMSQHLGQDMVEEFILKLFARPSSVHLLTTQSAFTQAIQKKNLGTQSRVSIYSDSRLSKVVYILFDKRVALILLNPQESVGVIFNDDGLFDSSEIFFRRLWEDGEL